MTISQKIKAKIIGNLITLLNRVPVSLLSNFSASSSRFLSLLLKRERAIALAQISFALPEADAAKIFKESIYSAMMTSIEGFRIIEILDHPDLAVNFKSPKSLGRVEVEGLETLEEIMSISNGAICLAGHLGNFELMAAYFSLQGFPISVIARSANDPVFHEIIVKIRKDYGLEILWREDPGNSKQFMKAIRNNRFICALIDQDIELENEFTPFFGLDAAHPISLVKVAVRFKKPVLFWRIYRDSSLCHHISLSRIHWENADSEDKEQYILKTYSQLLEQEIREHPGQWVWWHRRWRRRPGIDYSKEPEKLPSTKKYIKWIKSMTDKNS